MNRKVRQERKVSFLVERLVVFVAILAVTLAGCAPAVEARTSPTVPAAATATTTWTPLPPTATSTPSQTPTPTPIPVSVVEMPDMLVTLSFVIPPEVASGGTYEFVPYGSEYKKAPRLQQTLPRYGQFTLSGYPAPVDAIEEPAIRVFTTAGMTDRFVHHVEAVHQLAAGNDNPLAKLPAFPNLEAAALQTRLVLPMGFKNGYGFRYINFEIITEKDNPIPKVSASYIYQGITEDNKFYLSVILPIDLPPLRQKAQELLIRALANPTPQPFEAYYPEILPVLESAADDEFIPSLRVLDEIIQSLEIRPK